jgi:hypothetical protein
MGGSEMTSEGEAEYAWIMGKRFVQCDMVSGPSAPWQSESMTIYGYDTRFKRYTMWGIDTMGTYSVSAHSAENGYDATTRKIVMEGTNEDPDHGTETFRWVLTIESEDRHVQEIYFNRGDGWPEKPMVRIELTRAE